MKILLVMTTALFGLGLALAGNAETGTKPAEFRDGGFESDSPNGTPPDGGAWKTAWLGEAGGVVTLTAARSGNGGLWAYTGQGTGDRWSGIYQELPAKPGLVYRAAGWVRTPANEPWVPGSKAMVQVRFLDASGTDLVRVSAEPLTKPGTEWQRQALVTCPAPEGTTRVRLVCYLEKPADQTGLSVANFDDLYLAEAPAANAEAAKQSE